jgi:hypothetical protein
LSVSLKSRRKPKRLFWRLERDKHDKSASEADLSAYTEFISLC